MKTQDFGWSLARRGSEVMPPWAGAAVWWAQENYQKNRSNGGDEDSPARSIPLDGKCSDWVMCPDEDTLPSPLADGTYKEGLDDVDYDGWYRIRYHEGPGDKAWMEERDGNYLARLEREGQAEKAADLRASLPPSHPDYRALIPVVPVPSPQTQRSTPHHSGQGAGSGAAAPSPTPSGAPFLPAAGAGAGAAALPSP